MTCLRYEERQKRAMKVVFFFFAEQNSFSPPLIHFGKSLDSTAWQRPAIQRVTSSRSSSWKQLDQSGTTNADWLVCFLMTRKRSNDLLSLTFPKRTRCEGGIK